VPVSSTDLCHGGGAGQCAGRLPGHGDPSLHLLPLEAAAGPLWPGDPAAQRATSAAHGQCHQPLVEQRVVAFASATRGSGRPASPPSSPGPNGVGSCCRPTGSGGCWAATACPPGPSALGWSPAMPLHRRLSGLSRSLDVTWTSTTRPAGPARLLLHRPLERHQGHRLAVHRHRRRLGLHLGDAPGDPAQSLGHLDQPARPAGGRRPGRPRLEAGTGDERQRLGVPLWHLRPDPGQAWRPPDLHPRWSAQTNGCVERVQQTILDECWKRAFARYLIPKQTGLRLDLERYLRYYHRTCPHRPLDPWPHPNRGPREGQAVAQEALMRRHISGTGHPSPQCRTAPVLESQIRSRASPTCCWIDTILVAAAFPTSWRVRSINLCSRSWFGSHFTRFGPRLAYVRQDSRAAAA
jgi:hypothetical protein